MSLTYLFIAHDLSVVEHISNRVAVMYLGKIVELAPSVDLYRNPGIPIRCRCCPRFPRTIRTQEAAHRAERRRAQPAKPPSGCRFHPRCSWRSHLFAEEPPLRENVPGHWSACHFAEGAEERLAKREEVAGQPCQRVNLTLWCIRFRAPEDANTSARKNDYPLQISTTRL